MLIPQEEIRMMYSQFPKELSEVSEKAYEFMVAIIKLREKYKEVGRLPLYAENSDYENLNRLLLCIELEILKFGNPGVVSKEFHAFSNEELKELYADRDEFLNLGLDEWEEEGLLKFYNISQKNSTDADMVDIRKLRKKKLK